MRSCLAHAALRHSGIGPIYENEASEIQWFPRTRGDRAYSRDDVAPRLVVPPHARG